MNPPTAPYVERMRSLRLGLMLKPDRAWQMMKEMAEAPLQIEESGHQYV